jgi:hypothetical protein
MRSAISCSFGRSSRPSDSRPEPSLGACGLARSEHPCYAGVMVSGRPARRMRVPSHDTAHGSFAGGSQDPEYAIGDLRGRRIGRGDDRRAERMRYRRRRTNHPMPHSHFQDTKRPPDKERPPGVGPGGRLVRAGGQEGDSLGSADSRPESDGLSRLGADGLAAFVVGFEVPAGVLHAASAAIIANERSSRLNMGSPHCVSRRVAGAPGDVVASAAGEGGRSSG